MKPRALVVDDEALIRETVARALEAEGWNSDRAADGASALAAFRDGGHHLVILDLKLPDRPGLEVLEEIRRLDPTAQVLVITAHGTIEAAVQAMRLGAFDFVRKPFELEELLAAAKNAIHTQRLERRLAHQQEHDRRLLEAQVVRGSSAAMAALWREMEIVARQPVPVVAITGESGTGKSLLARLLHYTSPRAAGPFLELNAAAIPDTLLESELFGHERGAFSDAREAKAGLVEVADGGTLLIDEVGDLTPASQAKLLTFLESMSFRRLGSTALRTVDLRVVVATNQRLEELVAARRFRSDLFYRLRGLTLEVPPLRERREDIPPLVAHFLEVYAHQYRKRFGDVSEPASRALEAWRWPGNVRELGSVIQRAVLMNDAPALELEHLPPEIVQAAFDPLPPLPRDPELPIPSLEEAELRYIRLVYELCGRNKVRAAERLKITRQTLARRLGEQE
jgi:DNA-binding NtrC family response regulator